MNIIELELLSDDLTATAKFYKEVLGLDAFWWGTKSVTFHVGYTKLIYRKSDGMKPVYHFAIDVPNNRFEQALTVVKSKTPLIPVEGSDVANFVNWKAKSLYFYDNNGNILELITRYANQVYAKEEFSGKSYISVSEIGMVANNVPELADTMKKLFGIPIFHRQPRGEHFTVSGDDEGLFIIASKDREWYPTDKKSKSFYTRILFMDKGSVYNIVR